MAKVSPAEYRQTQEELIDIAAMVQGLNLEGFLENIEYADTIGPILDPTLWIRGADRMHKIQNIARAALVFQKECIKALGLD